MRGFRICARGLSAAWRRAETATAPSCSLVVPWWCMWRWAASAYGITMPMHPNGSSNSSWPSDGPAAAVHAPGPAGERILAEGAERDLRVALPMAAIALRIMCIGVTVPPASMVAASVGVSPMYSSRLWANMLMAWV